MKKIITGEYMKPSNGAPSTNYRTFVLVLLTLVYTFNFIDRQIIGAVSPFIKDEMGLSDRQLGFLKGFAFAALYCTVGIPIACPNRFSSIHCDTDAGTRWRWHW